MQFESTSLRAGVMARRIALLAVVALALGAATWVLARSSVEQAPTAELSFNPDAAYHDDFSLSQSGQPSVAAAQPMLNDAVILELLTRVGFSARDSAGDVAQAIGNFRSRLDLTEPWLETLQVRYRDPDPRTAAVVANAVATELAEGAPPARVPPARHGRGSARAAVPAWENPYRIMRLASVPPRILADPLWLAGGISAFFFAAGLFGGFLVWLRARQAAYSEDAVQEGTGFTLLPPMLVAQPTPQFAVVRREAVAAIDAEAEEAEEPAGRKEPVGQMPFVFEIGQKVGIDAPFLPRTAAGEELAQPRVEASAPATVSGAPLADREAETPKWLEMSLPEGPRETAAGVVKGAESAPVEESPAAEPEGLEKQEGMEGGRISLADPGAGDAQWNERILLGFAGTSIGQMLEAELRRGGTNGVHRRPPGSAADSGDEQGRERA